LKKSHDKSQNKDLGTCLLVTDLGLEPRTD
jgi:hypothetical protein